MTRLLLLPEILAHLSSVCTKSRSLINNRKKSARLLSFAYLFTKEQCILLACELKSKVTFILHCRNTGNKLTNKSNCHSSVQGRSKHITTFSGKVKTTMIYHIPQSSCLPIRQSSVPLSDEKGKHTNHMGFTINKEKSEFT